MNALSKVEEDYNDHVNKTTGASPYECGQKTRLKIIQEMLREIPNWSHLEVVNWEQDTRSHLRY